MITVNSHSRYSQSVWIMTGTVQKGHMRVQQPVKSCAADEKVIML